MDLRVGSPRWGGAACYFTAFDKPMTKVLHSTYTVLSRRESQLDQNKENRCLKVLVSLAGPSQELEVVAVAWIDQTRRMVHLDVMRSVNICRKRLASTSYWTDTFIAPSPPSQVRSAPREVP